MSLITTHVLDTSRGLPARGINVSIFYLYGDSWNCIGKSVTNDDGRVTDLLESDSDISAGIYKLKFETGSYFEEKQTGSFYPYIEIIFDIKAGGHLSCAFAAESVWIFNLPRKLTKI